MTKRKPYQDIRALHSRRLRKIVENEIAEKIFEIRYEIETTPGDINYLYLTGQLSALEYVMTVIIPNALPSE